MSIRETVLVHSPSQQRKMLQSAMETPEGMPPLKISLDQDERTSLDATQYGQFSAHLSSYRNINQERLPGEKALALSPHPSHRPFLPDNSPSLKAEPETAHEESFQLEAAQTKTGLGRHPDGEVHYKQEN